MSVVALERGTTEAADLAGLRYVDASRGVFVLNDVFDFVYLFFADHAYEYFVLLARVVAYTVGDRNAAVKFAGDFFRYCVVVVGNEVEHDRRLETGLNDVRHLRSRDQRKERIEYRRKTCGC